MCREDWSEYNTGISMWRSSYNGKLPEVLLQMCLPTHCDICIVVFRSPDAARKHYLSRKHSFMVNQKLECLASQTTTNNSEQVTQLNRKLQEVEYCNLCNVNLTSTTMLKSHYGGKRHIRAQRLQEKFSKDDANCKDNAPRVSTHERFRKRFRCDDCNVLCRSKLEFQSHQAGKRHQMSSSVKRKKSSKPTTSTSTVKCKSNTPEVFKCEDCNVNTNHEAGLQIHYQGRHHK